MKDVWRAARTPGQDCSRGFLSPLAVLCLANKSQSRTSGLQIRPSFAREKPVCQISQEERVCRRLSAREWEVTLTGASALREFFLFLFCELTSEKQQGKTGEERENPRGRHSSDKILNQHCLLFMDDDEVTGGSANSSVALLCFSNLPLLHFLFDTSW